MDIDEIPIREFVPPLGVRVLLIIEPKTPFTKFVVAVHPDEFVLISRRRLVLAPSIPPIRDEHPFGDQILGILERLPVQSHSHDLEFLCCDDTIHVHASSCRLQPTEARRRRFGKP